MTRPNRIRLLLPALVLLLGGLEARAADRDWELDLSLMAGHNDNFFYRGENAEAPGSDVQRLSAEYEHEFDLDRGDLVFELGAIGNWVSDIDNADYEAYRAGLQYERGRARWYTQYSIGLNRLFSEAGEPIFFDGNSIEGGLRYSLGRETWVRAEAELEDWDFDAAEDDRDSEVLKLAGTVRHGFTDRIALRASLLWEDRDAVDPKNNRTGTGWSLAFELKPADRLHAFLRYRSRDRDYDDAPVGEKNFEREDTVVDIVANLRLWIGSTWGVQVQNYYRDGESTRPDRNYDGNTFMAGLFLSL